MILKQELRKQMENTLRSSTEKKPSAMPIEPGKPGDVIVLAGKGHEDYQEIKGVKHPMDERVLIAEVLKELHGE